MTDPSLGLNDGTKDIVSLFDDTVLETHGPARCAGESCCFHNPSDHPLREAPMMWVRSINLMVRLCEHGLPHPDPDSLAFLQSRIDDVTFGGWHPCCSNHCCGLNAET